MYFWMKIKRFIFQDWQCSIFYFTLHRYPFKATELQRLPKTGWAATMAQFNPHAYENSVITDQATHDRNITYPFIHDKRVSALDKLASQSKRKKTK